MLLCAGVLGVISIAFLSLSGDPPTFGDPSRREASFVTGCLFLMFTLVLIFFAGARWGEQGAMEGHGQKVLRNDKMVFEWTP